VTESATPRRPVLSTAAGFWVVASAFLAVMAFSTVPTPLYSIYQERDGFPTGVITVIFAAYAVGVMLSLYLVGHISDWAGRRWMIVLGILAQLVAAAVFLGWQSVPALLVARVISGIGVGVLTASATASLTELRTATRPEGAVATASTVATLVNVGGLALGPLLAGILAEYAPLPLTIPYLVFVVLLVLAGIGVVLVPETVDRSRTRPAYRPQRISLPPASRNVFLAAGAGAFASFGIFGLFTSLAPSFLAGQLHETSRLVAGLVSFGVFAAAAVTQVFLGGLPLRRQVILGVVLMVAGLSSVTMGVLVTSLPAFVGGSLVAGAGVGLVFRGSLGVAGAVAEPARRGEVLAAMFLIAYGGLVVPVLAIGVSLALFPATATLVGFSAIILVLVLVSGARMARAVA
jgi:hypothetical protein